MEGGGAGGLGEGPFLLLLNGTEAPILKLVPAAQRLICEELLVVKVRSVNHCDCTFVALCLMHMYRIVFSPMLGSLELKCLAFECMSDSAAGLLVFLQHLQY